MKGCGSLICDLENMQGGVGSGMRILVNFSIGDLFEIKIGGAFYKRSLTFEIKIECF